MATWASSPWPAGCKGALSLTFDDGTANQLEKAVPVLEDLGLRATFYLNPRGEDPVNDLAPWRELAKRGHEIGNHTIRHICSKSLQDNPDIVCLERMTLQEMEEDILEASRRIRIGIPEQKDFTFCYPCYLDYIGEGLTRQSYVPVVARHFIAARGRGEFGHNHPATCDLAYLWSWNVEGLSGPMLVGLAEQAVALGRWVIFTLHGIDRGGLSITEAALRELCRHLDRRRNEIWVAPMVQVAQRVKEWRQQALGPAH